MKVKSFKTRILVSGLAVAMAGVALVGCSNLASIAKSASNGTLTAAEIASGLKEALTIGVKTGINVLSANNGYYNDVATRIGLPSEAAVITKNIAKLPGGQDLVTACVKSINATASDAAGDAVPIFTNAVTSMTITDAKNILKSGGTAATDYFKTKTKSPLKSLFTSYIGSSMKKKLVGNVSAQSSWSTLTSKWNTVAGSVAGKVAGLKTVNTDLTSYLTDQAVDGIYYKVGQQEKKIRTNVSERTTALLKKVFAQQ